MLSEKKRQQQPPAQAGRWDVPAGRRQRCKRREIKESR